MNKYDFDFIKIGDALENILGIVEPDNIDSLKEQICDNYISLQDALYKKNNGISDANIRVIEKKLESIKNEESIENVLRECIRTRYLTLLRLDTKVRLNDSADVKAAKLSKQNELKGLLDLVNSVKSITKLINDREVILKYINSDNRKSYFSTDKTIFENDGILLDDENSDFVSEKEEFPQMKLNIILNSNPNPFPDEYRSVLENAGIYAYKFGDLVYSSLPDENGRYTQELTRKKFVGVIKKNEFGEVKKYSVIMDEVSRKIPPEFYRDILFSDILLRNAKNNYDYLGAANLDKNDSWYGYKVEFNDVGVADLLRAIYFENDPSLVKVESDVHRIRNVSNALDFIQDKMEKALKDLFEPNENDRAIGDD